MDSFITTFESVAILLGIGFIGFWIIKRKIIPGRILSLLSPLALEIALPSLIFADILKDFTPEKYPNWWQLPLWWLFFTIIAAGLTIVFMYVSQKKTRNEFAVSLFYQNGIFFPLAILAGIFGDNSSYLTTLFLFTIFYPAFFFSTYQFFFPKQKQSKKIDWKKIFHPVLIATVVAIIISSLGFQNQVPGVIKSILLLLGGMTVPLLMIILGGNIYVDIKKQGKIQFFEITKFVTIKNFMFPIIFLLILTRIDSFITKPVALIILLQAAVPPVTAVPLVTERSGGNRGIVSQFMVASFLTSLISIPLMVLLFNNLL